MFSKKVRYSRRFKVPDLTEMTVEGAKKTVWKFLWDFENDGFPSVYAGEGARDQTLVPDSRLKELKEAICFLDNEYYYMVSGE
jgi:hypothetical protein